MRSVSVAPRTRRWLQADHLDVARPRADVLCGRRLVRAASVSVAWADMVAAAKRRSKALRVPQKRWAEPMPAPLRAARRRW